MLDIVGSWKFNHFLNEQTATTRCLLSSSYRGSVIFCGLYTSAHLRAASNTTSKARRCLLGRPQTWLLSAEVTVQVDDWFSLAKWHVGFPREKRNSNANANSQLRWPRSKDPRMGYLNGMGILQRSKNTKKHLGPSNVPGDTGWHFHITM